MVKPAALYKDRILQRFKEYYYTDDMFYVTAGLGNWSPDIQDNPREGLYQLAVMGYEDELIGYIEYSIDWYTSCAKNFGIFSFERGDVMMGIEINRVLRRLILEDKLHRIEWRMVGGNPVENSYDKFCEQYGGTKHVLRDACKDAHGQYHDDVIYEIITDNGEKENTVN